MTAESDAYGILQRIVAACIGADALCVDERYGDDGVVLVASPMDRSDWTVWHNIAIVTTAEALMASGLPAYRRVPPDRDYLLALDET